jgi:hypothetical protein
MFLLYSIGNNTAKCIKSEAFYDPTSVVFSLQGEVLDGEYPLPDVTVNFYIDNIKMTSAVTNNRGIYKINLHHNTIYTVETLKEGFIPEKVILNTKVTDEILKNGGIGETFDFTINVFTEYPGLKTDVFSDPLVYYFFNALKGWYFEPDARKSKMGLISQTMSKTNQLMEHDYQKLIQEGDKALLKRNVEAAFFKYAQAQLIIPEDETAIENSSDLIRALKKEKKLDAIYAKTIAKADEAFAKQDYENARANYNYAKILKRKEKYPKNKLISIDSVAQIIYLKNRETYDSLNFKAEELFANKEFNKALEYYEPALKIFPNDAFLKKRIGAINKSLKVKEAIAPADKSVEKAKQPSVRNKNKK